VRPPTRKSDRGGTARLGDVLSTLMQKRGYAQTLALREAREAWTHAVGDPAAGLQVLAFRDGVLTVGVASAAERYELEAFRMDELLDRWRSAPSSPPLRRIVFKLGGPSRS